MARIDNPSEARDNFFNTACSYHTHGWAMLKPNSLCAQTITTLSHEPSNLCYHASTMVVACAPCFTTQVAVPFHSLVHKARQGCGNGSQWHTTGGLTMDLSMLLPCLRKWHHGAGALIEFWCVCTLKMRHVHPTTSCGTDLTRSIR